MRNFCGLLTGFVAVALTYGYAQGPRGGMGSGQAQGVMPGQPHLDMTQQMVVQGEVTKVNIAFGAQYPSIEVQGKQIKIAPAWFLLENDFELREKDNVSVVAAPSTLSPDPYLHAISIVNNVSKAEIKLRDEYGVPLWLSRRGRASIGDDDFRGSGALASGCIDPATIGEVAGVVREVTMGFGIQHPTLVLETAAGLMTIKIGSERVLLANDFELKAGDAVKVRIATAACCQETVALQLTKGDKTLKLRNDDGSRAW